MTIIHKGAVLLAVACAVVWVAGQERICGPRGGEWVIVLGLCAVVSAIGSSVWLQLERDDE